MEGYSDSLPRTGHDNTRKVRTTNITINRTRCTLAGSQPVPVRSNRGPRIRLALPHSRPRRQRNDAPLHSHAIDQTTKEQDITLGSPKLPSFLSSMSILDRTLILSM